MSTQINTLAVINPEERQIVPKPETVNVVLGELRDMDRIYTGRIRIASGGVSAFEVTEPGEDESEVKKEIEGVILMSHKTNAYWPEVFGSGEDKQPACSSMDGEVGIVRDSGETVACKTCQYNDFGSASNGRGKACKNARRVYLLREGDILPMVFTLPPTALGAFDKYRMRLLLKEKSVNSVVTRIALKKESNRDGVAYSAPVFDASALLPPGEVERAARYAEAFIQAAQKAGITADDYDAVHGGGAPTTPAHTAREEQNLPPSDVNGFVPVDEDELPY